MITASEWQKNKILAQNVFITLFLFMALSKCLRNMCVIRNLKFKYLKPIKLVYFCVLWIYKGYSVRYLN